jgi:hypothetical protein
MAFNPDQIRDVIQRNIRGADPASVQTVINELSHLKITVDGESVQVRLAALEATVRQLVDVTTRLTQDMSSAITRIDFMVVNPEVGAAKGGKRAKAPAPVTEEVPAPSSSTAISTSASALAPALAPASSSAATPTAISTSASALASSSALAPALAPAPVRIPNPLDTSGVVGKTHTLLQFFRVLVGANNRFDIPDRRESLLTWLVGGGLTPEEAAETMRDEDAAAALWKIVKEDTEKRGLHKRFSDARKVLIT